MVTSKDEENVGPCTLYFPEASSRYSAAPRHQAVLSSAPYSPPNSFQGLTMASQDFDYVYKYKTSPGTVTHTCKSCSQEVDAGGF